MYIAAFRRALIVGLSSQEVSKIEDVPTSISCLSYRSFGAASLGVGNSITQYKSRQ